MSAVVSWEENLVNSSDLRKNDLHFGESVDSLDGGVNVAGSIPSIRIFDW